MTRPRVNLLFSSWYGKLMNMIKKTLNEAKLVAVDVNEFILVGGGARLPRILELLARDFPTLPTATLSIDPEEAIVKGNLFGQFLSPQFLSSSCYRSCRSTTKHVEAQKKTSLSCVICRFLSLCLLICLFVALRG